MRSQYREVADLLYEFRDCVVLTGSGISVESGISTFRSGDGLWEKFDPAVYCSIDVFREDPSKYWELRGDFIKNYDNFQPNNAHKALAELEGLGILKLIITQNIDGLHIKAGSENVAEIHGSLREIFCVECNKEFIAPNVPDGRPPLCSCGGVLKPNTVLYGESLPHEAFVRATEESRNCKTMLSIGTSSVVYPAASLPQIAKEHNAVVIEINIEKAFDRADYYITEKAEIALPIIVDLIKTRTG